MSRVIPRGGGALCALAAALLCLPTFAEARPPGAEKSRSSAAAKRCSAAAKRSSKRQRRAKRRCLARLAATKRDRTKPVVAFAAPAAGATVSGTLSGAACEATATDKGGVNRVEFSVDGIALNAQRTAPYNCVWDTTGVSSGQHKLTARAVDAAGNADSASVTVSVAAAAPAPAPAPPQCSDGVDNSDPEDTLVDLADPGCSGSSDDDETNAPPPQCSDGIDNADPEDTLVDLADPGCADASDNDETNSPPRGFPASYTLGRSAPTTCSPRLRTAPCSVCGPASEGSAAGPPRRSGTTWWTTSPTSAARQT